MKIQNYSDLARTPLRKTMLEIIEAGLNAVDTASVMRKNIKLEGDNLKVKDEVFQLNDKKRIFVVGIGKCALEAGQYLDELLGDRITDGIVLDIKLGVLKHIRTFAGDHPYPSQKNQQATKQIIDLLSYLNEDDFVIFVISGGGSTLLCQPENPGTWENEIELIKEMFKKGLDIEKINIIRKHISLARGGNLAQYTYPASFVSLIFSDVPGNDAGTISSGPTYPDTSTLNDAKKVIDEYGIDLKGIPLLETPKDRKYFEKSSNIILVSNETALLSMRDRAIALGFNTTIKTETLSGEAKDVGFSVWNDISSSKPKTAYLYGGETTVSVKGTGKGGRNQEVVLSSLRFIKDGFVVASVASDGRDNTPFAGALCDSDTKKRAIELKLNMNEYLEKNDSYHFFENTGDYLLTGITGSNVADLIIALHE